MLCKLLDYCLFLHLCAWFLFYFIFASQSRLSFLDSLAFLNVTAIYWKVRGQKNSCGAENKVKNDFAFSLMHFTYTKWKCFINTNKSWGASWQNNKRKLPSCPLKVPFGCYRRTHFQAVASVTLTEAVAVQPGWLSDSRVSLWFPLGRVALWFIASSLPLEGWLMRFEVLFKISFQNPFLSMKMKVRVSR